KPGDELVTTNREHGNAVAIMRFLEESRGVVVRRFDVPATATSEQLYLGLLSLVTERTRLVLVSEIDCLTGWMPDLSSLAESLEMLNVHLLVDGAHSPGHIIARPSRYPLWVGSGHKWLGAPNGTGFAYVARELIPFLEPTRVAQHFFDKRESEIYDLTRFECNGGNDMARWFGLTAAIALYESLHPEDLFSYQKQLVASLAERLFERFGRRVNIRTPIECNEYAGMLTFYFPDADVAVKDLRKALYDDYKIWIQPDFIGEKPGHGARISCHYSNTEAELGSLIEAIASYI
ncbi:MAG TPA: aminotransferase class V-fold PLP-dependent enzyme, partial [Ktedonobacteraceae bacterium]|nr:aminotransferase class V-fold PLP-dependent enzyme [Ktedonobacteraceae bacterium]